MKLRSFLAARINRESDLGLRLTASVALLCAAVWVFGGLMEEVLDKDALVRWDVSVNRWFNLWATPPGLRAFNIITDLGTPTIWIVAGIVVAGLWWRGERLLVWTWVAAMAGGSLLEHTLKATVHRHRPEYAAAYLHGQSYSFPSGHAMGATICYMLLSWTVSIVNHQHGVPRAVSYSVGLLIALLVGMSRLYLGVHYPSDVAAGVAIGLGWLAACVSVYHIVQYRRARPA